MKKHWTTKDGDVKEVTAEMMKHMRPLRETDPEFIARFEKERKRRGRGRPAGRTKAVVSRDIFSLLRASGSGWQSRINALLRAAMGLNG